MQHHTSLQKWKFVHCVMRICSVQFCWRLHAIRTPWPWAFKLCTNLADLLPVQYNIPNRRRDMRNCYKTVFCLWSIKLFCADFVVVELSVSLPEKCKLNNTGSAQFASSDHHTRKNSMHNSTRCTFGSCFFTMTYYQTILGSTLIRWIFLILY